MSLKQLKFLGKKSELEFEQLKFKGKLAGVLWRYSRNLDGVIRVRAVITIMAVLVYYPVLTNYAYFGVFSGMLFFERVIYSIMLLSAGMLFNKFRIASIILASIPLFLIFLIYISAPQLEARRLAFTGAIFLFVLSGIYHHIKLTNQKRILEEAMDEIDLIIEN